MTPLEQRIEADMVTAMKQKKAQELLVVRQLRSALKNAAIDSETELSEEGVIKVIQREFKKLNDSLADFKSAGREDLATATAEEMAIVKKYLPESLSTGQLRAIAQKVYNDMKERGVPIMKGPLMGAVMKEVGTRAQGSDVIPVVDQLIQ